MRSFVPKSADLKKDIIRIDVSNMILGRISAKIAHILRGKHKPIFMPGFNCGDKVVVLNSDKIKVTGDKLQRKILYKHTGYIGNMKELRLDHRMEKDSTEVIRTAVKRMLPRGPLGRAQLRLLDIYKGAEHRYGGAKMVDFKEMKA